MSDLQQQQQSSEGGGSEQQQQQAIVVPVPGGGETSVVPGQPATPEERIKLFVGQIPRAYTEKELRQMFEQFGPVVDVHVLTDKFTGNSKGCGFVVFSQQAAADSAMSTLHNQVTLPGMHNAVQVKPADSEQGKDERKLFIGMISRETTEEDVRMMFGPYGTIEDCTILRSQDGVSRCCGFVRMATRAQALAAIEKLHHSQTLPVCSSGRTVRPVRLLCTAFVLLFFFFLLLSNNVTRLIFFPTVAVTFATIFRSLFCVGWLVFHFRTADLPWSSSLQTQTRIGKPSAVSSSLTCRTAWGPRWAFSTR
eukprot:m.171539 g.171539  ORF g.171539 m.171539 type:complete len:308 (+) comp17842_c0_seq11:106-1029(+)